jgi:hypothetical protein
MTFRLTNGADAGKKTKKKSVHAIARTTLKTSGSKEWWEVPFYFLYMFLIGITPVVNCDKKLV